MDSLLSKFKSYQGEWYTYKEAGVKETEEIILEDKDYTLNLRLDILGEDVVYFRLEDYKEYFLGNKRRGPQECDLTLLEGNKVYQIEIKDVNKSNANSCFKEANKQLINSDNILRFILWFVDPADECGLKNFDSEHIIVHIRKQRESLERGICYEDNSEYKVVRIPISRRQNYGTHNLRKIIKNAKHPHLRDGYYTM